jgi:hypothetical protein
MSTRRSILGIAALAVLLTLAATPVAAGGAATAEVTSGLDEPPVAGEDREVRVLLLQHGVTPVDFGTVTLTGVLAETGESISAEATPMGAGTWAATIAFPASGDWQLRVMHDELATPAASTLTVVAPGLSLPSVLVPIGGVALVGFLTALAIIARRRSRPSAPRGAPVEPSLHRS